MLEKTKAQTRTASLMPLKNEGAIMLFFPHSSSLP
jgi:hypothetical protein